VNKLILVLAPHTDDGEFGCGGTIAKYIRDGWRAIYVAFSAAEQSVLPHLPRDVLRKEVRMATAVLGIAADDCIVLDFEVRKFPEQRQGILEKMVMLNRDMQPDLVFLPSPNDTHQDHKIIAHEGFRAFKKTTMLGYEVPWNNLDFRTSCFTHLSERDLEKKVEALSCYESQADRAYARGEVVKSQAIFRGTQIGTRYAEAFEVIRWIIG
jgi:N-acetylglucosamine malate deacetylase 1